jgi:hypothetical protein
LFELGAMRGDADVRDMRLFQAVFKGVHGLPFGGYGFCLAESKSETRAQTLILPQSRYAPMNQGFHRAKRSPEDSGNRFQTQMLKVYSFLKVSRH